jgi:hypothetical protein
MPTPQTVRSRYLVSGLCSPSCATKIAAVLKRLPGVVDVSASACTGIVTVERLDDLVIPTNVERQLRALGHKVTLIEEE